jgi:hypothetical protein
VDVGGSAHLLIENVTQDFKKITRADLFEQLINESKHQRANQKADLEAAGLSDAEDDGRWTTFSRKSTEAALLPAHFFPPDDISVSVRYDIENLQKVLPASQCFGEVRQVKRYAFIPCLTRLIKCPADFVPVSRARRQSGQSAGQKSGTFFESSYELH